VDGSRIRLGKPAPSKTRGCGTQEQWASNLDLSFILGFVILTFRVSGSFLVRKTVQ
jgi:hypothetical protein